jgi:hypothetical protein
MKGNLKRQKMKSKIELYFEKEALKKQYKRLLIVQIFSISILIGLLIYQKVEILHILIVGIISLLLAVYILLPIFKKMKYDFPGLIIEKDSFQIVDWDNFLRIKVKKAIYEEIKSLGMDIHDGKNKREVLSVNFKNGKSEEFDIKQFNLDNNSLCSLINEVNPNVKILNIGTFEYDE